MKHTEELFNSLVNNDENGAFAAFESVINSKLQTALDVKKVALTADIFSESTETDLQEGVYDPAIFKAVFLAGGPGSGKSFTVGKTGLTALGFKIVNSDDKFEHAMKKAKMEMSPENIFSPVGQDIRNKAKARTKKQQNIYLDGRLGLVIDGTGKDFAKIKKQAESLKELGYDVSMILVNTDLETSLVRNRMRERSLADKEVEKMWSAVQNNIGKFQSFFKDRFIIVDNSQGSNIEKATTAAYKKIAKFANEKHRNPIAREWIKQQLGEDVQWDYVSEEPLEESADSVALVKCHTPQAAKRLEQKLKNKWSGFRDGSYHLKVVGDTLEVKGQRRFTRFIENEPEVVSIKG